MGSATDLSGFRGTEDDGSEIWDCWQCGGEGGFNNHDVDPLWYPPDDWEECDICQGKGYIIVDPKKASTTNTPTEPKEHQEDDNGKDKS